MSRAVLLDHQAVKELAEQPGEVFLTEYKETYRALSLLVNPPGAQTLLKSVAPAAQLFTAVPWLPRELCKTYEAFQYLPELARSLALLDPGEIRSQGLSTHRVLQILAFGKQDKPHDKPLRALVLTLSAHRLRLRKSDAARRAAIDKCIEEIATAVNGLYISRRTGEKQRLSSPLLPLLQECAHHESLQGYVNHLRQLLLSHPDANSNLRVRFHRDVAFALGISNKPTQGPKKKQPKKSPAPTLPEDEPTPDPPTIRIQMPSGGIDPIQPEPPEETQPAVIGVESTSVTGQPPPLSELLRETKLLSRPQQIYHSNELLLVTHVDVLTPAEAKLLATGISAHAIKKSIKSDTDRCIQAAIAGLMLSLGYELTRATGILSASQSEVGRPRLTADRSHLISPALIPEGAFQAADNQQSILEPTEAEFHIPLPPPLVALLELIPIGPRREARIGGLKGGVSSTVSKICQNLGLRSVTMGRLRRTCSAQLYEYSKDLPAVMHLARDTFAQPLTPLYYCNMRESYLQDIFRGAIWPLWSSDSKQTSSTSKLRLGSQALPKGKTVRHISHSIGAAMQAPTPRRPDLNDLVRTHNTLARHLTGMLLSVVGHRPTNALFDLRAHSFDLHLNAAIIHDKCIDLAHVTRLVALGSKVSEQIQVYLCHLKALSESAELPEDSRSWIIDVLTSQQPLLFTLSETGFPTRMSIDRWRADLPEAWSLVPHNWGRHFLASVGRELDDISPELLHIQLGHYESAGYPFSVDSPLNPLDFLDLMNPALDELFRRQGWSCRGKAKDKKSWQDSWQIAGPLQSWDQERNDHALLIGEQRRELRKYYQASQRSVRDRSEDLVLEVTNEYGPQLFNLVHERIQELRVRRSEVPLDPIPETPDSQNPPAEPDEPVRIPTEDILAIQEKLEEATQNNPALQIAARNVLARCLRWAARKGLYAGLLPGIWIFKSPADPSPFLHSNLQATLQIRLLRKVCSDAYCSSEFQSNSELRMGTVILSLIVHGGIDKRDDLAFLLDPDTCPLGAPPIADSIIASQPGEEKSIGLAQKSALAYAIWCRDFRNDNSPSIDQLECALQTIIPDSAMPKTQLLKCLLATMAVANQIERSGLCNFSLEPQKGCVSLPYDRLLELLGHSAPSGGIDIEAPSDSEGLQLPATQAKQEYLAIKAIWPNKHRDLRLPLTNQVVELTKRQLDSRKKRVYDELVAMSGMSKWSPMGRSLAGWLAWELADRRPNANRFRRYGGIYSEFVELASRLVTRYEPVAGELDAEVLEELFFDVVQTPAKTNLGRIVRGVKNFHRYLILFHDIEPVNMSEIDLLAAPMTEEDYIVDNQMMLPHEISGISGVLTASSSHPTPSQIDTTTDYRIARQTQLLFCLLRNTGARFKEIMGLQYRDVILAGEDIYLIIRRTGYLDVKTRSARRLVHYSSYASAQDCDTLRDWIHAEESIETLRKPRDFVLADLSRTPVNPEFHRRLLRAVYQSSSSWNLKNHHSRHTVVSDTSLSGTLALGLNDLINPEAVADSGNKIALPRDLQKDIRQRGHKLPRTSIRAYMHLPWAFGIASQSRKTHRVDRHTLAATLGVSPSAADNRIQRHGPKGAVARALRQISNIVEAELNAQSATSDFLIEPKLNNAKMSQYLHARAQEVTQEDASRAYGLNQPEIERLHYYGELLAERTSISLFADQDMGAGEASNPPRWYGDSKELQRLWAIVELGGREANEIIFVADQWYAHCRRSNRSDIRLPRDATRALKKVLAPYGFTVDTEGLPESKLQRCVVSERHQPRSINHVVAWVLAICWTVAQTKKRISTSSLP